jgi:hypothetical protein
MLALVCASVRAACITYAWRVDGLNARGQKKAFTPNLYRLIDTQGRGVHGPDERGLERLFSITSNYITVRLASVGILIAETPKFPAFKRG